MANTYFLRGLRPIDTGSGIKTKATAKSTSSVSNLFIGSPIYSDGTGIASAVVDGSACAGTVVALLDSDGLPTCNLATTAAGTVIYTYEEGQQYAIYLDETDYAELTDIGKTYDLVAESATLASGSSHGDSFSKVCLDSSTESAADGIIKAGDLVRTPTNVAATAYTEVYCTINTTHWQDLG